MKIPQPILGQLQARFNLDANAFESAHDQQAPTSVRLNPLKPACGFLTGNEGPVPWADKSYYLHVRPVFTADPLFHAGCYYVQEASSMFLSEAVKQTVDTAKRITALDACAAPGGKSTLLAALLSAESLLVSNEVISTRVPVLVHNMAKWGAANNVVTNNDPKDFSRLAEFFDLVVVDAPCSGSGLFRKQEDAVAHWSEEHVKHCSLRQQRILHDLLPSLKENGVLIYSTCSYSVEENEDVCDQLLREHALETLALRVDVAWGVTQSKSREGAYGYRFLPHLAKGEGFFIACFRKLSGSGSGSGAAPHMQAGKKRETVFAPAGKQEQAQLRNFIGGADLQFAAYSGEIIGFNAAVSDGLAALTASLKVKKLPVHAGQFKGKDFVPHAFSAYIPLAESLPRAEVSTDEALKFLRKQDLQLPGAPKAFVLVTYKGFGLGWAKNLGNRLNNYYPADWRILKETF